MALPRSGCRRLPLVWAAALLAVAVLPPPPPAAAHSYLTYPRSMSRMQGCRVGGHEDLWVRYCPGPCPNVGLDGETSPSRPAAVWARGGRYSVTYARNNHEGGFIRWALVPVALMHNKWAHHQAAFMHSCWVSDRHTCEGAVERERDCAVDKQNSAFRQTVTVPDVYPDGDYVLSWVWYGGGLYGQFGDYYDCSFIRISGGNKVAEAYQATFQPGINTTIPASAGCLASVDRIGACPYEARGLQCGQAEERLPRGFRGGRDVPTVIYSAPLIETQKRASRPPSGYPGIDKLSMWLVWRNKSMPLVTPFPRINKHHLPAVSVAATTKGVADMVEWYVAGIKVSTQFGPPYFLTGKDRNGRARMWANMPIDVPVTIFARACDSKTQRCSKKMIAPTFFHQAVTKRLQMRQVLVERAGTAGSGVLAPIRAGFQPVNVWRITAVNIRAELYGDVRSVEFWVDGKLITTTFEAPFLAWAPEVGWSGFQINRRFVLKIVAKSGGGETFVWEQDMLFYRFYDHKLVLR